MEFDEKHGNTPNVKYKLESTCPAFLIDGAAKVKDYGDDRFYIIKINWNIENLKKDKNLFNVFSELFKSQDKLAEYMPFTTNPLFNETSPAYDEAFDGEGIVEKNIKDNPFLYTYNRPIEDDNIPFYLVFRVRGITGFYHPHIIRILSNRDRTSKLNILSDNSRLGITNNAIKQNAPNLFKTFVDVITSNAHVFDRNL